MPDHRPMETKRTVKERIFQEFKEVVPMFLYLWLLFALFTYHEAIVLARHIQGAEYRPFTSPPMIAKLRLVWPGRTSF